MALSFLTFHVQEANANEIDVIIYFIEMSHYWHQDHSFCYVSCFLKVQISVNFSLTGASEWIRNTNLFETLLKFWDALHFFGGFLWGSFKACGLFVVYVQRGKGKVGRKQPLGSTLLSFTTGITDILSFTSLVRLTSKFLIARTSKRM